ncbi:MAG: 4-alpha-glucanotransferase [Candidatus Omnitrophica bacterium]|nr:4-alpha-glucanotransferase [Candidatus Omnitrophota bacterium]
MYEHFLDSISRQQWQRIGLRRRSGVATPLFSVYSRKSIGIGEIPDLNLLVDWCGMARMSILQLLPLNDVGFGFTPYDAQSSFALEPMYLRLTDLKEVRLGELRSELDSLRHTFPCGKSRVNYRIKQAKLGFLHEVFQKNNVALNPPRQLKRFKEKAKYWIRDYALFKVIKDEFGQAPWEAWPKGLKERNPEALLHFESEHKEQILFYIWLEWQLFEQFLAARRHARKKKVLLMGDLPFLPSRDSADVWAHQDYFKLEFSSGAPPDAYFFKGQRWGSPPCHWERISANAYDYVLERLRYAEHFYDALRVDHVVGFFRLWTIPMTEPLENAGMNGFFDPRDESVWEGRGKELLSFMANHTKMLIVAEDLGTVPECSFRTLQEFGIPGMDVERWMRDSRRGYAFRLPEEYRPNAIATISTHDMTSFNAWWEYEADTVYEPLFERSCKAKGIPFEEIKGRLFDLKRSSHDRLRWKEEVRSVQVLAQLVGRHESEIGDLIDLYRYTYHEKERFWNLVGFSLPYQVMSSPKLAKAAIEKTAEAASIFNIQLLQDWLALGEVLKGDSWNWRINFPGVIGNQNWSMVLPISLEALKKLPLKKEMKAINKQTGRI